MSGSLESTPSVIRDINVSIAVFGLGTNHEYFYTEKVGSVEDRWLNWTSLHGDFSTSPVFIKDSDGRLFVLGLGKVSDAGMYYNY